MKSMTRLVTPVLVLAALAAAVPAAAQTDAEAATFYATREALEERLRMYEEGTRSGSFSDAARSLYEQEIELIRTRLREGDFQVGDRIDLRVAGHDTLTGSFVVAPGRVLILPDIEEISLDGLLRSELQPFMQKAIARYVRDPNVRVRALFQVALLGHVENPGFHWVSAETLLTDLVMTAAGGPTADGDVNKIKIERGSETIWRGDALQAALQEGRTLDQLNLRSGDQIEIPGRSRTWSTVLGMLPYVIPLAFAVSRFF